MAEIIEMGCLQFNEQPRGLGVEYNGEAISFGDTTSGKAIPFAKWKNLWVATQCVCTNVSWGDLDKVGFIFGRPVKIDGAPYLCRALKVGAEEGAPNEWDSILDDLGEDEPLWHWENQYFWGQETPSDYSSSRAVRGWSSARYWNYYYASSRNVYVGFRPALEPLPPEPLIANSLVGADLKIYGPSGDVVGQLIDFNDYDLVIHPISKKILSLTTECKASHYIPS